MLDWWVFIILLSTQLYVLCNIFNMHVFLSFGVQNIWFLCFTNGETKLILGHLQKGKPRHRENPSQFAFDPDSSQTANSHAPE